MSKVLVVGLKPHYENEYRKAFSSNPDVSCSSLQCVCHKNDTMFSIPDYFRPLKLNFFKDVEKEYLYNPTDVTIDCSEFDYILFAADSHITTFYAIMEFCERNNVLVNQAYFKDIFAHSVFDPNDVINVEYSQHFFDMSIDDFIDEE